MEIVISAINFVKVFAIAMSVLYCLRVVYDIAKVITLRDGKVDMGKYGMFLLGCSVSYIIACIFS